MTQLTEYEYKSLDKLGQSIQDGKWSNEALVQLIELAGDYLNIQTIPNAARSCNMSYNGVKKTKSVKQIFGVKFIIANQ